MILITGMVYSYHRVIWNWERFWIKLGLAKIRKPIPFWPSVAVDARIKTFGMVFGRACCCGRVNDDSEAVCACLLHGHVSTSNHHSSELTAWASSLHHWYSYHCAVLCTWRLNCFHN